MVHAFIAAFVVYVNQHINSDFNLPSSIVGFLSILRLRLVHFGRP